MYKFQSPGNFCWYRNVFRSYQYVQFVSSGQGVSSKMFQIFSWILSHYGYLYPVWFWICCSGYMQYLVSSKLVGYEHKICQKWAQCPCKWPWPFSTRPKNRTGLILRTGLLIVSLLRILYCLKMDAFTVSPDFGYVILVVIASIFMTMWKGFQVGKARKQYEVPVSCKWY